MHFLLGDEERGELDLLSYGLEKSWWSYRYRHIINVGFSF